MRRTRLKKQHTRVDKSVLAISTKHRIKDEDYLASFNGCYCVVCKIQDGTIVPAHIRKGWFGTNKPHDFLTSPLCSECHRLQGEIGEVKFWKAHGYTIKQIKKIAEARYRSWKHG